MTPFSVPHEKIIAAIAIAKRFLVFIIDSFNGLTIKPIKTTKENISSFNHSKFNI
jgi:hypothetical protein